MVIHEKTHKSERKNWITLQELFLSSLGFSLTIPGGLLWERSTWVLYLSGHSGWARLSSPVAAQCRGNPAAVSSLQPPEPSPRVAVKHNVTMQLRNGLYSCQVTWAAIKLSSTDLPTSEPTCLTSAGIATGPWGIGWRCADIEMNILRACPAPECRSSGLSLNKLGHGLELGSVDAGRSIFSLSFLLNGD